MKLEREAVTSELKRRQANRLIVGLALVATALLAPVCIPAYLDAKTEHGPREIHSDKTLAPPGTIIVISDGDAPDRAPIAGVIQDGDWNTAGKYGWHPDDDFGQVRRISVISTVTGQELFHSTVSGKVTRSGDTFYWWDADGRYQQLLLP